MKNFLLITTIALLTVNSFAQNSFPTGNAIWNTKIATSDYVDMPHGIEVRYCLEGDTSISNITYNKLYILNNDTAFIEENVGNYEFIGGIREVDKKVWYRMEDQEYLLYDYGADVGDTIWHNLSMTNNKVYYTPEYEDGTYSVVQNVEVIDGIKHLQVITNISNHNTWVEGIGSYAGFFGSVPMYAVISLEYYIYSLGCFKHNGITEYISYQCGSCFDCPYRYPLGIHLFCEGYGLTDKINFCYQSEPITVTLSAEPYSYMHGYPPFTYYWTTNSDIYTIEDNTISNPTFSFTGEVEVNVFVSDAGTCGPTAASLTLSMNPSQLSFSDSPENLKIEYGIKPGDSVFLSGNVLATNPNSTFLWSPCESILSDCTVTDGFWAKPDSTTEYRLTAEYPFNQQVCTETFPTYFYKVNVKPSGISSHGISNDIKTYPNPVKDILNIEIPENTNIKSINIYSMDGRLIENNKYSLSSNQLNISNLETGSYIVVIDTNNTKFTETIIKQ